MNRFRLTIGRNATQAEVLAEFERIDALCEELHAPLNSYYREYSTLCREKPEGMHSVDSLLFNVCLIQLDICARQAKRLDSTSPVT